MEKPSSKLLEFIFGDQELGLYTRRILSLLLMTAAIVFAWLPHQKEIYYLWLFKGTATTGGFKPDMLTGALGISITLPLYLRGILIWSKISFYEMISLFMNITLMSTLCRIIFPKFSSIFDVSIITTGTLVIILFIWLGMRSTALFGWIGIFVIGIINLHTSHIMGLYGYLFLSFGFMGILLNTNLGYPF